MKIDLILNLWKRDDYWLEECYDRVVGEDHWKLYAAHARSDAQSRKGEEYERHFGILIVTDGDTDEVKCHGLINIGWCLGSRDLINRLDQYLDIKDEPNNGLSGFYSYKKVTSYGDMAFQRWLGRITCPPNQYPKD